MNRCIFLAAFSVVAVPPAHADWQYTRWGMSVQDVLKSSGGAARVNNDTSLHGEGFRAELVAPYKSGPYQFRAAFQFRPGRGLSSIELKAAAPSDCAAIRNSLIGKYGRPHDVARDIGLLKWWDKPSGNIVIAIQIGEAYCSISYQPLSPGGGSQGL